MLTRPDHRTRGFKAGLTLPACTAALAALAASVTGAAPAFAKVDPPADSRTAQRPPPGGPRLLLVSERDKPGGRPGAPGGGAAGKPGGGIRETPLNQPGNGGVGTLDQDKGGFGADMWHGTPRRVVLDVLPRLPVTLRSAVRRELTQRLLLSTAQPPRGEDQNVSLLGLRLELLFAMGAVEDVIALAAAARPKPGDGLAARAVLSARIISADARPACGELEAALKGAKGGFGNFVERALVACHALAGDHFKATGGLRLMAEQGTKLSDRFRLLVTAQDDPALLRDLLVTAQDDPALLRDKNGGGAISLDKLDAIEVALLTGGKLRLPKGVHKLRHPAYLRAVALSGARPASRRIAAAEAAFRLGAVDTEDLGKAYRALSFRKAELDGAARVSLKRYGAKTRALMYQEATATDEPKARLAVLANWWRLARAAGDWPEIAALTAPLIVSIPPSSRWLTYAPHVARVYLAQGRFRAALRWYEVMRKAPFRNQRAFLELKILMHLARPGDVTLSRSDLASWVRQQRRQGAVGGRRLVLLRALVEGVIDDKRDRAVWNAVIRPTDDGDGSARGAPAVWRGVRGIARDRKVGEAVMLILVNLGDRDIKDVPPADLREALRALRDVRLDAEARRLAVEAALAAGI